MLAFQNSEVCTDLKKKSPHQSKFIYPWDTFLSLIKHLNISVNDFYNKEMRIFTWCIENQSINTLIHCFLGQSILNVYMSLWLDFKLFKAETTFNISFSPTHLPVGIKCTLSQWFFHSRANALYYSRNNTFLIR